MSDVVVAYVPVLHEGYRRFLENHARGRMVYLIGPGFYGPFRPLAKDIRALDVELVASALRAWQVAADVQPLTAEVAKRLRRDKATLFLPDEDISYQVVERTFPRNPVYFTPGFLRWDKTRSVRLIEPRPARIVPFEEAVAELVSRADEAAAKSLDWWRQVGAAIRFADGQVVANTNKHLPHPDSPYAVGDPRANFFKGTHLHISTAEHAEAGLIARAAREGRSTEGAVMYVTDFPCPPCAKLIAGSGITRLYYGTGYAVLDGKDVLEAAEVEIIGLL